MGGLEVNRLILFWTRAELADVVACLPKWGRVNTMTNKHYENLGRIADSFQGLEQCLASSVWKVVSEDAKIGQIIIPLLPFGKLCILANSLYQYKFAATPFANKFTGLVKRCLILEEKRNQLFHSIWLDGGGRPRRVRRIKFGTKLDKGSVTSVHDVSSEELGEIAKDMRGVLDEFFNLWDEMTQAGLQSG